MIPYIETHITNHCNLNCAGCTHYAPLAKPWFKDLDEYVKEIAQLSALTKQKLPVIRILGGEPLLHPQVLDFCYITRQAFPYAHVELVTNGILLLSKDDAFFKCLNDNQIHVYLSDYGLYNKINDKMKEKLLPELIRIGPRETMIKPAVDFSQPATNTKQNFLQCKATFLDFCYNLRNGYIYPCPTSAYADILFDYFNITLNNFNLTDNGINIFEHSLEEIEQFLESSVPFCQYCDGNEKLVDRKFALSKKHMSEWIS